MTRAPRALTSCTLEMSLSYTRLSVATTSDRGALLEQGDGTVLHLARGVGVGGDVGDLLELERALEGYRQAHVPAQAQEEAAGGVLLATSSTLAAAPSSR